MKIRVARSSVVVFIVGCAATVSMIGGVMALAQDKSQPPAEQERNVQEAEVPKLALDALKKLASGASLTEFAEEVEYGHKFYEGSWKGPNGNIDALVTESGAIVEIEEAVPMELVPTAVRTASENLTGKGTASWEKKTIILYEVHFDKDGKRHEIVLTPDGRQIREEGSDEISDKGEEGERK